MEQWQEENLIGGVIALFAIYGGYNFIIEIIKWLN